MMRHHAVILEGLDPGRDPWGPTMTNNLAELALQLESANDDLDTVAEVLDHWAKHGGVPSGRPRIDVAEDLLRDVHDVMALLTSRFDLRGKAEASMCSTFYMRTIEILGRIRFLREPTEPAALN